MCALKLRRHFEPVARHAEPVLSSPNEHVVAAADIYSSMTEDAVEKPNSSNAVFGLIGASTVDGIAASHDTGNGQPDGGMRLADGPEPAKNLIEALQMLYSRALDDPQASLAGEWAANAGGPQTTMEERPAQPDPAQQELHASWSSTDSIEVLLSGAHRLEHFFGPLENEKGEMTHPDVEPVPEILHLFAPPEYHAAAARRPPSLPPALTRREHHVLTVDSPLPAPTRPGSLEVGVGASTAAPTQKDNADGRA